MSPASSSKSVLRFISAVAGLARQRSWINMLVPYMSRQAKRKQKNRQSASIRLSFWGVPATPPNRTLENRKTNREDFCIDPLISRRCGLAGKVCSPRLPLGPAATRVRKTIPMVAVPRRCRCGGWGGTGGDNRAMEVRIEP